MESTNAAERPDPVVADVEERIRFLLGARLHLSPETLATCTSETPLLGQGIGLDSIEALTLAVALEEEFDIQVDDADLTTELFATIGTLATYVRSTTAAASR